MTVTVLAMFVMMLVVVIMMFMIMVMVVMIPFATAVLMVVLMLVVMTACTHMIVDIEVHAGILHGMHHRVLQISFVYIYDRGHEMELRFLRRFQTVVVLHTYRQIGEIECDALSVHGDGHLDVPHQITGLALDPSPYLHHQFIESRFSIRVETVDVSGESRTDSACQFS